jgi:uncharacterized protein (DUF2267 family)
LLQAGISPRLIAQGHLPLYLRPYDENPVDVIKKAFLPDPAQTPGLQDAPLRDFLQQVINILGEGSTLYIFLDQFEEVFTQLEEELRQNFIRQLAECLDDETLNVRWVLALRTEYFGNLANFRPRIRNPFENDYRLNRMNRDEAEEVITAPAARMYIGYEPALIEAILDDLGGNEIAPPQIQLVCSSLFDHLKPGEREIPMSLYEAEDRAAGILRSHLQDVLSRQLAEDQRKAARRLLESLITSEQQRLVRSQQELTTELSAQGITPQTLDTILTQLTESRLIRVNETENGISYELAHDYLLQEVQLDPEVQGRKAAQELLEQELRARRKHETLLTPDRLRVIEHYRNQMTLTDEANKLIEDSRKKVNRQTLITLALISGGLMIVFTVVFIVTVRLVNNLMFQRITENVVRTLEGSALVIDTENFETLVNDYGPDPDGLIVDEDPYFNHQDEILIIKDLFPQVDNVYTFIPGERDDEVLIIGDSWREFDDTAADAWYFKEPFQVYDDVGFTQGFDSTVPPDEVYQDEFGSWVSGFTPIKTQDGQSIGALGIDISVDYLDSIYNQVVRSTLPPFGLVSFLLLAITWISAWINRRGGVRYPRYKVSVERLE